MSKEIASSCDTTLFPEESPVIPPRKKQEVRFVLAPPVAGVDVPEDHIEQPERRLRDLILETVAKISKLLRKLATVNDVRSILSTDPPYPDRYPHRYDILAAFQRADVNGRIKITPENFEKVFWWITPETLILPKTVRSVSVDLVDENRGPVWFLLDLHRLDCVYSIQKDSPYAAALAGMAMTGEAVDCHQRGARQRALAESIVTYFRTKMSMNISPEDALKLILTTDSPPAPSPQPEQPSPLLSREDALPPLPPQNEKWDEIDMRNNISSVEQCPTPGLSHLFSFSASSTEEPDKSEELPFIPPVILSISEKYRSNKIDGAVHETGRIFTQLEEHLGKEKVSLQKIGAVSLACFSQHGCTQAGDDGALLEVIAAGLQYFGHDPSQAHTILDAVRPVPPPITPATQQHVAPLWSALPLAKPVITPTEDDHNMLSSNISTPGNDTWMDLLSTAEDFDDDVDDSAAYQPDPDLQESSDKDLPHLADFDPSMPTDAKPGTAGKISVLSARFAAGIRLFHPEDPTVYGLGGVSEMAEE